MLRTLLAAACWWLWLLCVWCVGVAELIQLILITSRALFVILGITWQQDAGMASASPVNP